MAKRAIRLSDGLDEKIQAAAKQRGFLTPSAFIRAAIENELGGRGELSLAEDRIAASFERVTRDIVRLSRAQQALFAYLDTLGKTILTCVPEPPAESKGQAVARAKERYDRFMKSAGRAMAGEARAAMLDLVNHGTPEG